MAGCSSTRAGARTRRLTALGFALLGAAGLVSGGLSGCSGDDTDLTGGVRVDQLTARDIDVSVTVASAVIAWLTRDPAPSVVSFGTTSGSPDQQVGVDQQLTRHRVELTGLAPDTIYYYRVSGSPTTYQFRTLGGARERIAFVSDRNDGRQEVYLAYELGENVTRVTTGGGRQPALSLDGTRLAFVAPGAGGADDLWTVALDTAGVVAGSLQNLTQTADRAEAAPDWSPDGTQLVFLATPTNQRTQIVRRVVADGTETVLLNEGALYQDPAWSPNGQTIAFASTTRTSVVQVSNRPIDPGSLSVTLAETGNPVVPAGDLRIVSAADGQIDFSASSAPGRTVNISYTSGGVAFTDAGVKVPAVEQQIATVAVDGTGLRLVTDGTFAHFSPDWSPDGAEIFYAVESGIAFNLWRTPAAGGSESSVTRGSNQDRDPAVSPDGTRVLFSSNRNPQNLVNLYQAELNGTFRELNWFSSGDTQPSWSVVP